MNKPTKVLFFATNTKQYNGYSYVIYELACQLAKHTDIDLTLYGFQNFYKNPAHTRELPANVYEYDAFANENPKQAGFGFEQVTEFVTMNQPDICVIYNDMVVVSNIIDKLYKVPNKNFKIIVYIDQVYLYQKKEYITLLNQKVDFVMPFTKYWQDIAKGLGITLPMDYLVHGFNHETHYPFPKHLARQYYSLKHDDFIILNLNRNQPRKRWDICMQTFAEVVSRNLKKPVKLLIATAVQGAWNLLEIYERELQKRGITLEEGMKHIILIDNPQQLTDEEVNILYNVADIGINTCDGEGFGLCNFQQAAIGIPQVVPAIGGFLEFFNEENAIMVEPCINLYIESSRDGVGGESQLCSYKDYADAIDLLINDPEARKKYGINGRRHINKEYKWCDIADKLVSIINTVMNKHVSQDVKKSDETSITLDDIQDAITDLTVTENEENLKTNDEKTLDVKSDVHKQTLKLSSSGEEKKVENQKPKEVSSDKNKKVVLTSRAQKILKAKKSSKKRQS
jgi:glycosyltransferase involved in cell wall biosynthesis